MLFFVCSWLIYLPSCLGQETVKWSLQSLSQAATCYYQSNSKIKAIPSSALHKDATSELASLSSCFPFIMLNVKQGSCEY